MCGINPTKRKKRKQRFRIPVHNDIQIDNFDMIPKLPTGLNSASKIFSYNEASTCNGLCTSSENFIFQHEDEVDSTATAGFLVSNKSSQYMLQ